MALDQYKTQILLLHSQQSTLDTLCTGFSEKYSVHVATSGTEALNIFNDTPVHVIVSAQDLPGMSGLDALREAKKRSPETIGILLAGTDQSDGLEALVGEQEVFQIVRGEVTPDSLVNLVESATKQTRLLALSESANDTTANVDQPTGEHIIMETSENGSSIISDGTGQVPILKPNKVSIAPDIGTREVDVLVLTKDEEFLATIRDSTRGLHSVHHAVTPTQANEFVNAHKIGVLVTDAAMVGSNIEILTERLRQAVPRLVAVVAGRRDDGELLMDLINRGQVYRFLLKPVSPGRARLAIEASVKHHLDAPDTAFKAAPGSPASAPAQQAPQKQKPAPAPAKPAPITRAGPKPEVKPQKPMTVSRDDSLLSDGLDEAFGDDSSFTETMTGIATSFGKKIAEAAESVTSKSKAKAEVKAKRKPQAPAAAPALEPIATNSAPAPAPAPEPVPSVAAASGGILQNPMILGGIAVGVIVIAVGAWFMMSSDDTPPAIVADEVTAPVFEETDLVIPVAEPASRDAVPASDNLLADARSARDAGNLIAPPGQNAVELYVSARAESPGDAVIDSELNLVIDDVVGIAESAILEQRLADAATALQMIELANPDNPRLTFLGAQLTQLQLRSAMDDARVAIRDGRFEDAGGFINSAALLAGSDSPDIRALSEELAAARSEQRIDEVLAMANDRLAQNQLITPSNNNARYYYELALGNDPDNAAARQGLTIVASKLAIQSLGAIEAGQLTNAEDLIRNARSLDPESAEVAAATVALQNAHDAIANQEQQTVAAQAEAEQLAATEEERQRRAATAAAVAAAAVAVGSDGSAGGSSIDTSSAPAEQSSEVAEAGSQETATANADKAESESVSETETGVRGEADTTVDPVATDSDQSAIPVETATTLAAAAAVTPDAASSSGSADAATNEPPEVLQVPVSSLTRINYVAPRYPRSAQRRNVTGSVDIAFLVAPNGTVADIEVLNSTPGKTFDQAAVDAVAKWRFEPVIVSGKAVSRRTAVRLAFNLQ